MSDEVDGTQSGAVAAEDCVVVKRSDLEKIRAALQKPRR
jgi:hypothetical protein